MLVSSADLQPQGSQQPIQPPGSHFALAALEPDQVGVVDLRRLRDLDRGPTLADALQVDPFVELHDASHCPSDSYLFDSVASVPWTGHPSGMGIRAALAQARQLSGLSQAKLAAKAQGWNPGNVSGFENGTRGASVDSIDAWLDACDCEIVIVKRGGPPEPREIRALPPDLLELLIRLARVLPWIPAVLRRDLQGRIESWTRDYPPPDSSRATIQDSTDSDR
jgi:transcriptional regulator with XRE-family HTH domain